MRLFAANSPIAFLLSLGVCISLPIRESRAQCASECPVRRTTVTGDWWGVRPCLEDHGIEFDAAVTQFYQGVASGGQRRRFAYGGHGDYDIPLNVALGKVLKVGNQPINIFVEPFYTPEGLRRGPASEWGVKLNVTFLFPDKKFGPLLGSLFDPCCRHH